MDSTNDFQPQNVGPHMDVHLAATPAFNLAYPDSFLLPDAQTIALGLVSHPGSFDPMTLMAESNYPQQDDLALDHMSKMDPTTYAAWLVVASERISGVSPFETIKPIQFDPLNLGIPSPSGMKVETGEMTDSFPCDMEQYICLNPVGVQSLATTASGAEHIFTSSAFSPLSPMTMVSGSVSPGNGTLSPPPLMSSPPLWHTPSAPVWAGMNPQFVSGHLLSPQLPTNNMAPLLSQEQAMQALIKFDMPSPLTDVTPFSVASRLSPPAPDQQPESALLFSVRNSASPAPSLRPQSEPPMTDSVAPTPTPPSSTSSTPIPPNPQSNPAVSLKGKALRLATYNKWSQEEDLLLRHAVSIHGTVGKWSLVASMVPGRTPIQCSTRWLGALNPTIHKGKWASSEDATLLAAYAELTADPEHPPWNKIAERIPGRTPVQCIARYQEALDPTVRKGKWCAEEDRLLRAGLEEYGKCWVKIASRIPGRTQRQCRTRWLQLRPKVDEVSRSESDSVGGSVGGTPEPGAPPSFEQSAEIHSGGPKRNVRRAAAPSGVGSTVAAAAGGGASKSRKRRESKAMDE
ncbi:hypothetical protein BJ742DRAFT_768563 [Cladochytrium replicatum]|nr:hypothetical protein BJ742DRAFT_768563 [Cladochytrium replicatum]